MLKVGIKIYRLGYMRSWCNGTMRYEFVSSASEVGHSSSTTHASHTI